MPPNSTESTGILYENEALSAEITNTPIKGRADNRKVVPVWRNVILLGLLHLLAVVGFYRFLTSAKWETDIFAYLLYIASGLGITAGAHRLWAHKSYKANLPLRVILTVCNTIAFQGSVIDWARDHRMHHKYSETDADPHNSTRGFFFSHVGWLMCKKHPEIKAKGHTIDFSDLYNDPILSFQKRYYLILMPLACFILPTVIPVVLWGETWGNAYLVAALFRYAFVLNVTWMVNSVAHMFGSKPYDRHISPVENYSVSTFALGEGFHNYHHTFPWDYKTAELGDYTMNVSKAFIDFMSKIGWAYDLKTASNEIIKNRIQRTGDGSHNLWGWGDKDQHKEEIANATIINKKE